MTEYGGVWAELIGQEEKISPLIRASHDPEYMTHAWLITGPPGSGRSNVARAFAAALLTEDHGDTLSHEARRILSGTHESMTVMRTQKSMISIEEVRALIATATTAPVNAPWRVMIIEDADRMQERTSNVLLKSIEEPPAATVWILCAPSPQDVVTTIRSRCRVISLRVPPVEAVADLLVRRDNVDLQRARWAASVAQSHIGRARHLANDDEAIRRYSWILSLPGRFTSVGEAVIAAGEVVDAATQYAEDYTQQRDAQERQELLETLGVQPGKSIPPALRSQVKNLEEEQKRRAKRAVSDQLDSILLELLSFYRDVLAVQCGAKQDVVNRGAEDVIHSRAEESSPADTLHRIHALEQGRNRLGTNMSKLLIVEAVFIVLWRPKLLGRLGV